MELYTFATISMYSFALNGPDVNQSVQNCVIRVKYNEGWTCLPAAGLSGQVGPWTRTWTIMFRSVVQLPVSSIMLRDLT